MIICSAVKIEKDNKEFVIMGKRHGDCFETLYNAGIKRPFKDIQGFVNDNFEFLTRHEAYKHVKACGQTLIEDCNGTLYSEDLW